MESEAATSSLSRMFKILVSGTMLKKNQGDLLGSMEIASVIFSFIIRHASYTEVVGLNCIIFVEFFSGIDIRRDKVAMITFGGDYPYACQLF